MPTSINKLNISNNSQLLPKNSLTSFDQLRRWTAAINSSTHSVQEQWNNTLYPLLSTLPQTEDVNAWTNGLDGKALYVDRATKDKFYDEVLKRPKTIKESIEKSLIALKNAKEDVEGIKRRIEAANSVLGIRDLTGDVTGTNVNSTVEKIQNRSVSSSAPADTETLIWDSDNENWEASTLVAPTNYLYQYIYKFGLTYTSASQITISPGICRSDDDIVNIELTAETTIGITTHLDTGSEAVDTWYYIWAFYNPASNNLLFRFSIQDPGSGTDPTAPSADYTKKRCIGSVRNDQNGDFLSFYQTGIGAERFYSYSSMHTILTNGNSSNFATASSGGRTSADYTPATAIKHYAYLKSLDYRTPYYSYAGYIRTKGLTGGLSGDSILKVLGPRTTNYGFLHVNSDNRIIEYRAYTTNNNVYVGIAGYIESL